MTRWKADGHFGKRCGHSWCSDCATRRGNNRGNRTIRHTIKTILRRERRSETPGAAQPFTPVPNSDFDQPIR